MLVASVLYFMLGIMVYAEAEKCADVWFFRTPSRRILCGMLWPLLVLYTAIVFGVSVVLLLFGYCK